MTSGDDLRLTLRRTGGRYSLVVDDLTRRSSSTLAIAHPAFLDGETDLYVGLFGANTQSDLRKTLTVRELERHGLDAAGGRADNGPDRGPRTPTASDAETTSALSGAATHRRRSHPTAVDRPLSTPSLRTSLMTLDTLTASLMTRTVAFCLGLASAIGLPARPRPDRRLRRGRPATTAPPLKVLFLGDRGHHEPADRAAQITPVLAGRGIEVTYTERLDDLNPETLAKYDALLIYANINEITPAQEKALLDYVEGGGAFVPVHCASYCFLNSPRYIALVGAQFLRHGTGEFETKVVDPSHPIMKGFEPFRTWDETYVHHKHNEKDRHVLQVRAEGNAEEPWTWVRTQGKGRVFYTAYGHDGRTWQNPGFHDLLERGIRWAVEQGAGRRQPGPGAGRAAAVHL